jgi:hypothetical protein
MSTIERVSSTYGNIRIIVVMKSSITCCLEIASMNKDSGNIENVENFCNKN